MKLTKMRLKQIIKEEIKRVLHESWGDTGLRGMAGTDPDFSMTTGMKPKGERSQAVTGLEPGRQRSGETYKKKGRDLKSRDKDATFARNSIKLDLKDRGADIDAVPGAFMRLLGHLETNEVDEAVALAIEMGAQDDGDLASEFDMYT